MDKHTLQTTCPGNYPPRYVLVLSPLFICVLFVLGLPKHHKEYICVDVFDHGLAYKPQTTNNQQYRKPTLVAPLYVSGLICRFKVPLDRPEASCEGTAYHRGGTHPRWSVGPYNTHNTMPCDNSNKHFRPWEQLLLGNFCRHRQMKKTV